MHQVQVADIPMYKGVVWSALYCAQALKISCIGQLVNVYNSRFGEPRHHEVQKICADKAGAPCD